MPRALFRQTLGYPAAMANWQWFTKTHRLVYEHSGGRVGARLMGIPMLLLTTQGRRTGRARTLPLACLPDGDDLVVVASNDGRDQHPAWWLNLAANPEAQVRFRREERHVRAFLATPEERARLWPELVERNPHFERYARKTEREIPVVILRTRS
jgi:deazaflavin-dependent oxidoreductase (nitroreductase family)